MQQELQLVEVDPNYENPFAETRRVKEARRRQKARKEKKANNKKAKKSKHNTELWPQCILQ